MWSGGLNDVTVLSALNSNNLRIVELMIFKDFSNLSKFNNPTNSPPLNQVPEHHIQTVFKHIQGWWPLWGAHSVLNNPFSKEVFPDIQPKLTLAHFPLSCHQWEETNPALPVSTFQVLEESNKISPQPPFSQTEQPQFLQLLLWDLNKMNY